MKKLVLMLFGLALVFGFAGCNTDGSVIDIDEDAFIASPVNLSITGTVLSWDAVTDADGYIVYGNGEEVDQVNTNSFNFSSIVEDRIIFQVRTKAPRGMQDSPLSISIAYIANPTAEEDAINEAMAELDMELPEGFAEELVNKGMLGSEAEDMVSAVQAFTEEMEDIDDIESAYAAINTLLADVSNIEAIVSAIVKVLLPEQIQTRIQEMENQRDSYQDMIDSDPWYGYYYQSEVDSLNNQIQVMENLLAQIQSDPDAIVLAITQTIDYFLSIEEMIDQNLIDTISSLAATSDIKDLNVTELVQVKEEVVNILRETMPTQEEMTLIFQVYDLLIALSGDYVEIEYSIEGYQDKMAIQSLYMIELYINFLDTLDATYFETVIDEIEFTEPESEYDSPMLTEMAGAEIGILTIKYFAEFKQDNQALIDLLSEVFTDEEKEIMFDDYIDALGADEMFTTTMITQLKALDFQQVLYLDVMLGDLFDTFLDIFVETDGEVIRLAVQLGAFEWDYYSDTYLNRVTGEEFSSWEEMNYEESLIRYEMFGEVAVIVQALLDDISDEDYSTLLDFISSVALIMVDGIEDSSEFTPIVEAFQLVLENTSSDQLDLVKNLVNYLVNEEVFVQLSEMTQDVNAALIAEFGTEYWDDDAYYGNDIEEYYTIITAAGIFDGFMTSGNRSLIDGILDEIFDAMTDADILEMTGLTAQDVEDMRSNIDEALDIVSDNFDDIKNYNPNPANLDAQDKEDINALMTEIQEAFQSIFQ